MNQFATMKVGYTAGIYGCSNEYYTTVYVNKSGNLDSISFYGMYGAEERIARAMTEKGYEHRYLASDYGKMKSREVNKNLFISEYEALEQIKTIATV